MVSFAIAVRTEYKHSRDCQAEKAVTSLGPPANLEEGMFLKFHHLHNAQRPCKRTRVPKGILRHVPSHAHAAAFSDSGSPNSCMLSRIAKVPEKPEVS